MAAAARTKVVVKDNMIRKAMLDLLENATKGVYGLKVDSCDKETLHICFVLEIQPRLRKISFQRRA